ncbi:MAG TPA: deoxyribose-phosphate aldolase [Thermoanaerobaculia bacterium]|nr:deoxyribose-phosphate aldolase [Thermoanaerobaculia bacterium]
MDRPLASYIDHTILKMDATREEVLRVVEEAAEHRFASVVVPPCYVEEAVAALAGEDGGRPVVPVGTVVAFPFGWQDPRVRLEEARRAVEHGARELDTVLNVSRLKSGDTGRVLDDLAGWVEALRATEEELVLKVIVETAVLTDDEKGVAAGLVAEAGADFVKTGTGFAVGPTGQGIDPDRPVQGGATVEDVKLLVKAAVGKIQVKAAGGIRDAETARALIEAGATRLGTSTGVQILEDWEEQYGDEGT